MNCTMCKINLDLSNYSKDKYRPSGLDATCKKCRKKQREQRKIKRINNIVPIEKTCSCCNILQKSSNFDKKIGSNDGLHTECKNCKKEKRLKIKQKNENVVFKDNYVKMCYSCNIKKNKNEFYSQIYSTDGIGTICIECDKKRHLVWRYNNKDKISSYRTKAYFKNYHIRRENNPQVKISENIRNRIRMSIKRQKSSKYKNSFELIDCSPYFLTKWLEYQFDSNMSWDNYGSYWSIDHVIPCAYFDLKNREEQLKCFNWRNCRPLNSIENSSKYKKIEPFQILLQEIKVHYYEQHIQIAGIS